MEQLEVIQKQIETERARLNQMEEQFGRLHPGVIRQSRRLDELINEYLKAEISSKNHNLNI